MDATQAFLLLVAVPIVPWAVGILVLRGAYADLQREWLARGQTPPFSRVIVASAYGVVPVVFGLSLWFLSLSFADELSASTLPGVADAERLFFWVALASGVASCCTVASQLLVLRGRFPSYMGTDFGRVLPLSVIPFTDAVFAMILGVLAFRYVGDVVHGGIAAPSAAVDSAVAALAAFALASLATPVSALVSNRVRDLSARGFGRAALIFDVGELPLILGLVLGFLAISGLSTR